MGDFLLELRTEEIPANALPGTRRQVEEKLRRGLDAAGFGAATVDVKSTNRRLVVMVSNLPERQPDRTEKVTGPPARVAFAKDGTPTKAAEGFASKVGVSLGRLERVPTAKGEYLAATVTHRGRATGEILAELVPQVLAGLHFPKTMRWGLGRHVFVRPVHGLVALFGDQVVPMEVFGVAAGRTTVGHRVHSPVEIEVDSPSGFLRMLEEHRVFIDPEERRRRLQAQTERLTSEVGCRVHPDEELASEHVELVEYPGLIRGKIDPKHLELPPEVVITTLRHHQKCLILEDGEGELAPYFLAIVDREDDPEGLIRQGNEWVIGARLADAAFFFAEDWKRPLAARVLELDRLDFHRKLGSVGAKVRRVGSLAAWLAGQIGFEVDASELERVSGLVKADLVTHMVGEFPELQGVMGGHYLRLEGEPEEVWTAARDHYLPHGFEGKIPASGLGRVVSAGDRLDTLAGLFAVGEIPTGSRDPFGLRRAAQGLVKIVAEAGWEVDLEAAARRAVELVSAEVDGDVEAVIGRLTSFLADRVRRYLTDIVGVAGDTAAAVMAAGWSSLPGLQARAVALEGVRSTAEFRALALAFKRVRNITEGLPDAGVKPELFSDPAERDLYDAVQVFHDGLAAWMKNREVGEAFLEMGRLAEVLDRFFVEVLVMAEDERLRQNRIAILKMLGRDFLTLADLAKLQVEGSDS